MAVRPNAAVQRRRAAACCAPRGHHEMTRLRRARDAASPSAAMLVRRHWLFLLNFFERPGAHLAAAHIAGDQHTARRAGRVRQGEGRHLCVVAEQALAAPK